MEISAPGGRTVPAVALAGALAAALAVGVLLGLPLGRSSVDVSDRLADPVSIGFAQDMSTHHAQAVAMSAVVHRRTADPTLSPLAEDVLITQQGQIGMMSAWLTDAAQPQTSDGPAMAWTGQPHDGPMPGMATRAELDALVDLPLAQMEEAYVRMLIRHHAGALPMAAYAAAHAESPALRRLARNMELGQTAEIAALADVLAARGLPPEPAADADHSGH